MNPSRTRSALKLLGGNTNVGQWNGDDLSLHNSQYSLSMWECWALGQGRAALCRQALGSGPSTAPACFREGLQLCCPQPGLLSPPHPPALCCSRGGLEHSPGFLPPLCQEKSPSQAHELLERGGSWRGCQGPAWPPAAPLGSAAVSDRWQGSASHCTASIPDRAIARHRRLPGL